MMLKKQLNSVKHTRQTCIKVIKNALNDTLKNVTKYLNTDKTTFNGR